jgi:osmotically-inducible protein OsmY
MNETNDIRAAVTDDLTFDPDVDASGITVENRDGDVVLSGSVPSYPQCIEALAVARRVAGVKNVHNHLEVALAPGDRRDDSGLTAAANGALTLGHSVAVGVKARAKNGDIILTGAVRCGAERVAAEALIASLAGVRSIMNDIQIRDDASPLPPYSGASWLQPRQNPCRAAHRIPALTPADQSCALT